ncbi:unnamed protein product, partial [marine sediment metagenome]
FNAGVGREEQGAQEGGIDHARILHMIRAKHKQG